jgi:hypothetical protein
MTATEWNAKAKADLAAHNAFVRHVAAFIGGWSATEPPATNEWGKVTITRPDGAAIYFYTDGPWLKAVRVRISGSYPESTDGQVFWPHNSDRPRISCAISRGPEAIAKDVARRFIPAYTKEYEKQLQAVARHERNLETETCIMDTLAALLQTTVYNPSGRDPAISYNGHKITAHGDRVYFRTSGVDFDKAQAIAKILAS